MRHTFSIIIPLYNCRFAVRQLLHNLMNQTYKDFEVIFIDDCSKDETINELKKYKDKISFEYNLLVNHENKGPGVSRNLCMEQATGQYVFFLDSDDSIDITTLEKISKTIISNNFPDAVLFDYFMVFKDKKIRRNTVYNLKEGFVGKENAIIYSTGSTCCKVYNLDVLKDNNIYFPDMRTKEDFVFNKIALSFCNKIFYCKEPLYNYIVNSSSIMNTTKLVGELTAKKAFDIIEKQIGKKYNNVISALKTKEYLFGVIQSMVRMKESNKEINMFINAYEEQNSEWYKDFGKYKFDLFTTIILKMAKKRMALLITCAILLKDLLKNHLMR